MMMQVQSKHQRTSSILQSILLRITSSSTLILRRGNIEAVTQGELDTTGIIVLYLTEHHAIAIECEAVDATIKEVVA